MHSGAGVRDADLIPHPDAPAADGDGCRAVAHRVLQQIHQDPFGEHGIRAHQLRRGTQVDAEIHAVQEVAAFTHGTAHQLLGGAPVHLG